MNNELKHYGVLTKQNQEKGSLNNDSFFFLKLERRKEHDSL